MKRINLLLCLMVFAMGSAVAQGMAVTKTMKLSEDEVPAAVRVAFERDFGAIPENGTWSVYYSTTKQGGQMSANPIWYTYTNKQNASGKIEVRFDPNGKVRFNKGIDKKADVRREKTDPTEKTSEGLK